MFNSKSLIRQDRQAEGLCPSNRLRDTAPFALQGMAWEEGRPLPPRLPGQGVYLGYLGAHLGSLRRESRPLSCPLGMWSRGLSRQVPPRGGAPSKPPPSPALAPAQLLGKSPEHSEPHSFLCKLALLPAS